ncbi:MAG: enoyl-CoA hydratase-related protein [Beijerinckiaceae bacterium]
MTITIERPAEHVAVIRLNRPEARNALNQAVREAIAAAIAQFATDDTIRVLIIAGSDSVFAAGADIKAMAEATPATMMTLPDYWLGLRRFPKPVIAAVNGWALGGGCELAMHADIIIAGESARFGQPEIKVGIMPGAGGTQRLTRAVGKFKAMKILLTGEPVSSREAEAMGLVSEVVADAEVMNRALAMAADIARLPPIAARKIKETVLAGADLPLDHALALERQAFQLLFATADQKEGMAAFIEKRKAHFKGQ